LSKEILISDKWRQVDIRIYAVLASLLISIFTIIFPDSPNDDAYTYIRTADIFLNQGFTAAYQHYEWATYSVLIAVISFLGLDLFTAALTVNALLYILLVYAYLSIIKEIGDSRFLLSIAAVCILVYPQLNEYRYFIIRDVGFWAFAVIAFWQFLRFSNSHSIKSALAYCGSLLIATTFRSEALAYLLLTPFALLLDLRYELQMRYKLLSILFGIIGVVAIGGLVLLSILGVNALDLFFGFLSTYQPFLSSTFSPDPARLSELGGLLFNDYAASYSQEYIGIFMLAGLFSILIANLFNAIGGPYLIVLVFGLVRKYVQLNRNIVIPIVFYLLINVVILFAFLLVTRYLTSRYAMLFCILLSVLVPIIIKVFIEHSKANKSRMAHIVISIFFTYCAIDSYYSFGENKNYVFDSIEWLSENTAESVGLITNNHAIAYFSGKVEDYDRAPRFLTEDEILASNEGDSIAMEMNFEMEQLLNSSTIAPYVELVAAFPDIDEQRVAIYKRILP